MRGHKPHGGMSTLRQRRAWEYVESSVDWEAGRKRLDSYTDGGTNQRAAWKMLPGGEASQRRNFVCNQHVKCPVEVRLVMKAFLDVVLEKLVGVKHTSPLVCVDRKNAALTIPQKAEVTSGLSYGGSCGDIVDKLSREALAAGAPFNAGDDATGVEGARL